MPGDNSPGLETGLHVNETLVGAAPEQEVFIALCHYEGAVHQHIQLFQEGTVSGLLQKMLIEETGVAPYCLGGLGLDAPCQLGKSLGLEEGVASGKGYIGKRIGREFLHQLVRFHLITAREVPRLRIVTTRTVVAAARTIYAGAESRPVHCGVMQDVQYPNCHELRGH